MSQMPPPLPPPLPPTPGSQNVWPRPAFELPARPQTRLSLDGLLGEAWRLMSMHYGLLIAAVGIWVGLSIAGSVVSAGLDQLHPAVSALWDLATTFLVDAPLYAGVAMLGLRVARGERPAVGAVFDGFRSYGPVVLANVVKLGLIGVAVVFVVTPFVAVLGLAGGLGRGGPSVMLVVAAVLPALVLGLGVYLFLFARLLLTDVLILDPAGPRPGPVEALRLSWRLTGPATAPLLLLMLLNAAIAIGTTMLLLIGLLLLGLPLMICIGGVAVKRMLESLDAPVCHHCGYDRSAAGGGAHCPECGRTAWRYGVGGGAGGVTPAG